MLVSKFGYDDAAQPISLREGETAQRDFQLKKKDSPLINKLINQRSSQGEIAGQVRAANGASIPNAAVELREIGKEPTVARTLTNAKGEYTLKAIAGRYELKVSQKAFQVSSLRINVQVDASARQDFVLKAENVLKESSKIIDDPKSKLPTGNVLVKNGELKGRITDLKSGVPISGAVVSITGSRSVTTDREGSYGFSNLSAGKYRIVIKRTGFSVEERELIIRAGENATLNFKLTAEPAINKR